jgi:hypothetical protein
MKFLNILKLMGQLSQYSEYTTGWIARFQFEAGARIFSVYHYIQTNAEANLASCPMGTVGYFPKG